VTSIIDSGVPVPIGPRVLPPLSQTPRGTSLPPASTPASVPDTPSIQPVAPSSSKGEPAPPGNTIVTRSTGAPVKKPRKMKSVGKYKLYNLNN